MQHTSSAIPRKSLLVGIAGGSASGKSTLATALVQALTDGPEPLHCQVFNTDRYFRRQDPEAPTVTLPSGEQLFDYNRPDSVDNTRLAEDLDRLSQGDGAPDVILVEGLMVLHTSIIRERLDVRLFVELDADERALRRLLRNLGPAIPIDMDKGHWIASYYNASARVGHQRYVEPSRVYADLILRGDADFARTAPMVAAVVRQSLRAKDSTPITASQE